MASSEETEIEIGGSVLVASSSSDDEIIGKFHN